MYVRYLNPVNLFSFIVATTTYLMNKKKLYAVSFVLLAAIFIAATNNHTTIWKEYTNAENVIGCAPDAGDNISAGADGKFINVLPGWGDHAYSISTASDSTQIYFNQGLSMYYSYHQREAVASFKEAARFDSTCAMAYWGQALAMGPPYNGGYSYKMNEDVPDVIQMMNQSAARCSAK